MKQKKKLSDEKKSTVTIRFDCDCPLCGHGWAFEASGVEKILLINSEFINPKMSCPMCHFVFPVKTV